MRRVTFCEQIWFCEHLINVTGGLRRSVGWRASAAQQPGSLSQMSSVPAHGGFLPGQTREGLSATCDWPWVSQGYGLFARNIMLTVVA